MKKKGTQIMAWVLTATMLCSQGVSAAVVTEDTALEQEVSQNEQEKVPVTPEETEQITPVEEPPVQQETEVTDPIKEADENNSSANEEQNTTVESEQAETAMVSEEEPVVGDTIVDQNITYTIKNLATETKNGQVSIKDGMKASGDITIPRTITSNGRNYDVTEMASNAFKDNTALTGIDFYDTIIKTVNSGCFYGCTRLTSVVPTQGATYLAVYQNAFSDCTALEKIEFNSLQIMKSAFSGSAIKEIVIMNPIAMASSSFNGMQDGFTLICPKTLEKSQIDANAFGSTKNPVLVVPNEKIKTTMETLFGTKVTVKLFNEQESTTVIVKAADGTMKGYEDFQKAFEAISQSEESAPYTLTVADSVQNLVWPENMVPAYATTIDFSNNSVSLPSTMVLEAPLTIMNVNNFTNTTLCTVEAGDNAFIMKKGGSFGFASISGSNLTFDGILPGSAPLNSAPCEVKGTGANPTLTLANIGRKDYTYDLPNMQGFDNLEIKDGFVQALADKDYGLKNIILTNGGMNIQGNVTIETLKGSGEVNLGEKATLIIKDQSSDNGVTVNSSNAVSVSGGTLSGKVYASFENAADIIEKDTGTSYTITLNEDITLKSNITLANKTLVIDGNGKTLSADEGVDTIDIPSNCDWKNINFALENVTIHYAPVTTLAAKSKNDPVIELEASVKGKLGRLLDDAGTGFLSFKVDGPDIDIEKITGVSPEQIYTITRLYLTGYGTEENPISLKGKVENIGGLFLDNSYITAEGDATYLGTVNAVKKTSKGALVITDDTTLNAISLTTGSAFVIKIPGNKKLTLKATTALSSNKIPITLTGDVKDGQILIDVDRPRSPGMFFLANAPENTILQYDTVNDDYVLHVHKYVAASDDTMHWQECTCGEKLEVEAHTGGTATCKDKAICEVCGTAYGKLDAANHTGGTEIRGRVEATETQKGYTGDTYCLGCGEKIADGKDIDILHVHKYVWKSDDTTHWQECTCGEKLEAEAHKGGTATCKDKAICEVCGAAYGELNAANHTGGTEIRGQVKATETQKGYTGDTYCLGCGEKIAAGTVIEMIPSAPETGKWIKNSTGWWYQNADGTWPANKWEKIKDVWYHFNSKGYMQTGWQKINNKWYYMNGSGAMLIGWQNINGKWYYMSNSSNDGSMKIGWQKINNKWYYMSSSNNDGAMKIGWQKINNKWYYMSDSYNDGSMKIGWQYIKGYWYYMSDSNNDGAMKTGWQKVKEKWYYMYSESAPEGHMAANVWIGKYYVDNSGAWTETR